MGTSAPAVKEHDFDITEPYHPPLQLPEPDPATFAPDYITAPIKVAEPVPVRRHSHESD
jgi:hypothetical protein